MFHRRDDGLIGRPGAGDEVADARRSRARHRAGGIAVAASVCVLAVVAPVQVAAAPPGSNDVPATSPHTAVEAPPGESPDAVRRFARLDVQGDSLTVGTLDECEVPCLPAAAAARGMRLSPAPSARVGRSVDEGLALLAHTEHLPARVLIALGTNDWEAGDSTAAHWIQRARATVGPSSDIFWVNLAMEGHRYRLFTEINAGLLTGVTADNLHQRRIRASGRSYVLDWYAYTRARQVHPGSDGVHYSGAIYSLRARFYAGAVAGAPGYLAYRLPHLATLTVRAAEPTPLPAPIRVRHEPAAAPFGLAVRMAS